MWYPLLTPICRFWPKRKRGISIFRISGQSVIKENCQTNKTTSKNEDEVMSANFDAIIIFPIHDQFRAIHNLDT